MPIEPRIHIQVGENGHVTGFTRGERGQREVGPHQRRRDAMGEGNADIAGPPIRGASVWLWQDRWKTFRRSQRHFRLPCEDELQPPHWGRVAPKSSKKGGVAHPSRKFSLNSSKQKRLKPALFRVSWAEEMCSVDHPCPECQRLDRGLLTLGGGALASQPIRRLRLAAALAGYNSASDGDDDKSRGR